MAKQYYIFYKLTALHGTVIHFFHFFMGILVPLIMEYQILSKQHEHVTIIIDKNLGPMLRILLELPFRKV